MIHKYIAFCLAFSFIFLTQNVVFGQIHKGSWLISGSAGLQLARQKLDNTTASYQYKSVNFSLSPDIGYFITDRIVLGGQLSTSFYHYYSKGLDKATQTGREETLRNSY